MADDTQPRLLHTIEDIRAEARRRRRARGDKLTPARAAHVAALLRPYTDLLLAADQPADPAA
jgi:hypothetical protein